MLDELTFAHTGRSSYQWGLKLPKIGSETAEKAFTQDCESVTAYEYIISVFHIITSAEMNQRALVGKAVAVGLGVANETVKQAINATQRYPF